MITIHKNLPFSPSYPLERIGRPEELLFFDIETTGFSGGRSRVYLIGAVCFERGCWRLTQWFADTPDSESALLRAFFDVLRRFPILIHFNGDRFDLPFLLKRCAFYGLDASFDSAASFDLYRCMRPFQKLLGLCRLTQKDLERFLGVCREDPYSGGELIHLYEEYLITGEDALFDPLILHNEEDLTGMLSVLPALCYRDFLSGPFTFQGHILKEGADMPAPSGAGADPGQAAQKTAVLAYEGAVCLPQPVKLLLNAGPASAPIRMELDGVCLALSVPLYDGELKYFYPDYQNYYYLIYEDRAVHKSVGQYVEKAARRQAAPKNCYTRVPGLFLPAPFAGQADSRLRLRSSLRAKEAYIPCQEALFSNPGDAERYLFPLLVGNGLR